MFKLPYLLLTTLFIFIVFQAYSVEEENFIYPRIIKWIEPAKIVIDPLIEKKYLNFQGAIFDNSYGLVPLYYEQFKMPASSEVSASLRKAEYVEITDDSYLEEYTGLIGDNIYLNVKIAFQAKVPFAVVSFIPFRKNTITSKYEKLVNFELELISRKNINVRNKITPKNYVANSVLANGNWYKIGVTQNGIYKLDYSFFAGLGISVAGINPQNIRIYGKNGGMLPAANASFRYDDITESAIYIEGESDGKFDVNDYILFYGEGPHQWDYDTSSKRFIHSKNFYADTAFYFITTDLGMGKRISLQAGSSSSANVTVTTFNDFSYYESDEYNFVKSGREWYGNEFDQVTTRDFTFTFPNIVTSIPVYLSSHVAARSSSSSTFSFLYQSSNFLNVTTSPTSDHYSADYVMTATGTAGFTAISQDITLSLNYNKPTVSSLGYLNYIELSAIRELIMSGTQMAFRDTGSVDPGNVAEIILSNVSSGIKVWEITDPMNVKDQEFTVSGSQLQFKINADSLREFIAFTGSSFLSASAAGKISNQDLHGTVGQPDMVIIAYPDFLSEAQKLATHHSAKDGLQTVVLTPQQIYNEFSSGSQDISAIRDFMKMLYDRAAADTSKLPRYLLMFGDASYDFKNKLSGNTNFVPTYQSLNSTSPTNSYASDDYFGFLDDNEGDWISSSALLDIGIGRLPVQTIAEATDMVNKIIHYASSVTFGDWRNIITFLADDEDTNLHINDADNIASYVDDGYSDYNIDKIYFDSYPQISTSGGQRYPDVNNAINQRMQTGTFIFNYTGHGGEVGWAHERVLGIDDINSWDNYNKMPLLVTATCEFSRFDDPQRTSAGELCLLNPDGGAIALLSTVRLVYASPNYVLNLNFYKNVFIPDADNNMPRLGDVFRNTKNASGAIVNNRNFTLLGDPALRLAYPNYNIITKKINGKDISAVPDTLRALSKVTIEGEVTDSDGSIISGFNGVAYPTIYDKSATMSTLVNDPGSSQKNYGLQKNILYKGKASVVNGKFSYTFIVPKDISYNVGFGRLSYYASSDQADANGSFENVIVSGTDSNAVSDLSGPSVKLFLNDDKFVFGGLTNENPLLIAKISDISGINTVGNGIGHDIAAVLDENLNQKITLNEYYEAALDDYQNGEIKYPFKKLSNGKHTLTLKVWDVYNNSSEAYTEFVVASSAKLALDHVLNYPNPFTTNTAFHFEHNRPGEPLDVQLQIFTISGKLVKTISALIQSEGNHIDAINWDGQDEYGSNIGRGVYIYRLKVRAVSNNDTSDKLEKLVILR